MITQTNPAKINIEKAIELIDKSSSYFKNRCDFDIENELDHECFAFLTIQYYSVVGWVITLWSHASEEIEVTNSHELLSKIEQLNKHNDNEVSKYEENCN